MDCFKRLETLVEAGGVDSVEQARELLGQFERHSEAASRAVDEFLIELMTLVFLVEAGREAFQNSARRLTRMRLAKLRLLLPARREEGGETAFSS